MRLQLIYVSPTSACQTFTGTYIRLHSYIVQPFGFLLLWLLLTSHSSLLLRLMKPPVRPHGAHNVQWTLALRRPERSEEQSVFFPRLPSRFTHMGYGYLLGFVVFGQLTRHIRLNIRFLFVVLRFRYLFFSPAPRDANLESRYRVRQQLRLDGLSPQNTEMPVIHKKLERPKSFEF